MKIFKTAFCLFLLVLSWLATPFALSAQRLSLSLNGIWDVEESISPLPVPQKFTHTAPVPGLVHLAQPMFPDVDLFDSRESLYRREELYQLGIRYDKRGEMARAGVAGFPRQVRNYFWFHKSFRVSKNKAVAILTIGKAQFGTAVWLNGQKIGEYQGCFSASHFDVTKAINWWGDNALVVRIGAHPGVLPDTYPTGADFEKFNWTPGIYDRVTLDLSDNPVIESIQVAPQISDGTILVQTKIRNYGAAGTFSLAHKVFTWKDQSEIAGKPPVRFALGAGEEKILTEKIRIPNVRLWSPEDPFLYKLNSSTGGDQVTTRFGMREFRYDASTGRAILNGKICYLRGSNICLHRFFEDPLSGDLPWSETWVRRLLVDIPGQMHWNSFRICIGPVPEQWLEIADEAGLLLQYEFPVWTGQNSKDYFRHWDVEEMIRQYGDWMRDNWNHPGIVVWDACNETHDETFNQTIIPAVRKLDLSNRPWDNGYNEPASPGDAAEEHRYLYCNTGLFDTAKFDITNLERMDGRALHTGKDRAIIMNEYDWLWVNRDGSSAIATEKLFHKYLGEHATNDQRRQLSAYWLAGLTEFWRAHRHYAGVQYFCYLTFSSPRSYTSDNFEDIVNLKLEPHFQNYMSEAFKPLGIYLNFWQPTLQAGTISRFRVMMVNDEDRRVTGRLLLSLRSPNGKDLVQSEQQFSIESLGQNSYELELHLPAQPQEQCQLVATAIPDDHRPEGITLSRRQVAIIKPQNK